MGRLFQYNRFGSADNNNSKDNNLTRNNSKPQESQPAAKCPAYSELYPEFNGATAEAATAAETATVTTSSATAATLTTTTTTSKSVELAIKKYQQWSSKFLTAAVPTTTTAATGATAAAVSQSSVSAATTASTTTSSYPCSASSGYGSSRLGAENDRELLVAAAAVRRPKVYDCMKDFLRRKLFQQNAAALTAKKQNVANGCHAEEDEATSDYDEVDMLDTSYNAEDEEDSTDCSCSCTSSDEEPAPRKSSSPLKSTLSLNCWQHSNYTDSTTEAEEEDDEEEDEDEAEDSDPGISDCCQLISDAPSSSSKRKSPKKQTPPKRRQTKQRHNTHVVDELPELLQSAWYQPRISFKAAFERLQPALPGSFLVRRKAKHFELCLRCDSASKVKRFAVLATAQDTFKLKGAKKQFTSLRALVTHHSVMAEQLPLTLALKRETSAVKLVSLRCEDDFDTFESLQILGVIRGLQVKSFELS